MILCRIFQSRLTSLRFFYPSKTLQYHIQFWHLPFHYQLPTTVAFMKLNHESEIENTGALNKIEKVWALCTIQLKVVA